MSDSDKKKKNPPPDDFSETVLNIEGGADDSEDWDKTSYNIAADTPDDDWGKTVINYSSSLEDEPKDDFDDTHRGGSAEEPDWGMTRENINLGGAFEADEDDFGDPEVETAATQHVIHIPEADRKKFQIPPTPTEKIAEERKEQVGNINKGLSWVWVKPSDNRGVQKQSCCNHC